MVFSVHRPPTTTIFKIDIITIIKTYKNYSHIQSKNDFPKKLNKLLLKINKFDADVPILQSS